MKVHRSYQTAARGCVVAIGNFDGIHRGHKALIDAARTKADALGAPLGIITFEPHPLQLLRPEMAPKRLTPFRTKIKILASLGVDQVYALTFNQTLRQHSPEAFAREILSEGLGIRHAVVGYDFRFGHKASGDTAALVRLGERHGFGVTKVDPIGWHGKICSSSRVRHLVASGDVQGAADLLGHPFIIEGRVVDGDKRGRELGFPTANIRPPKATSPHGPAIWPEAGVYAVRSAWQDGDKTETALGAANIGQRPTFDDRQGRLLEVHLLDRNVDLYGKRLCTEFVAHLRNELPFADVEDLKAAMAKDCDDARTLLANAPLANGPLDAYLKR